MCLCVCVWVGRYVSVRFCAWVRCGWCGGVVVCALFIGVSESFAQASSCSPKWFGGIYLLWLSHPWCCAAQMHVCWASDIGGLASLWEEGGWDQRCVIVQVAERLSYEYMVRHEGCLKARVRCVGGRLVLCDWVGCRQVLCYAMLGMLFACSGQCSFP